MNTTEPLGLPRGSVRAILALMIVAATLGVTIIKGAIPTDMVPLASAVVMFYFVSRDAAGPAAPAAEELPEPFVPGDDA